MIFFLFEGYSVFSFHLPICLPLCVSVFQRDLPLLTICHELKLSSMQHLIWKKGLC